MIHEGGGDRRTRLRLVEGFRRGGRRARPRFVGVDVKGAGEGPEGKACGR